MPGKPPRHAPSRESNRPGAKREPRVGAQLSSGTDHPSAAKATRGGDSAQAHADARRNVMSSLALGVTNRVIVLAATLAVLMISFVSSFSVYLGQQRDIAQTKAEISAHQGEIARLQDELNRWQDPAYIRTQARDRLGWVLPGEVGYRVIDANGEIIGGTVGTLDPQDTAANRIWYEALWLSMQSADRPVPEASSPPDNPVVVGPDGMEPPR